MRLMLFIVLLLLLRGGTMSQPLDRFRIQPSQLTIIGANDDTLHFAFAGGMNNCQLGEIDLNLDGKQDLIVFERHGNRIMPFIHSGIAGDTRYSFAPEFIRYFPLIRDWVQCKDYNQDGKSDLFTYTTGGIKVYRNESEQNLKFTQVSYPYLVSQQGSSLTNILVTYADYPAIQDLDNDGDLDILTFWGLGSFIEWHKNLSVENYGSADSLVFEKVSSCWGHFAEAGESNLIHLDTCVESGASNKPGEPKHTGSTLLSDDLNSDGLPDLVLGDVDFSTLIALINGGTPDEANMVSQTTVFPDDEYPVNLVSFPVAGYMDVNHDGYNDLWVSPFEPSLVKSDPSESCWLYFGTDQAGGGLNFQQTDFLQDEMIDLGAGAYPLLMDVDADGLLDLLAGNYGVLDSSWYSPSTGRQCEYLSTLTLFRNTGTSKQPVFRLESSDYLGLSVLKMQSLIPASGDLDGDGDTDLLCGNSKGKLVYLENVAAPGNAPEYATPDPAFRQIDVGDFSAPQIFDLDQDGMNDIIIGKRNGTLSFFRNTGAMEFELITDTLGSVDVTNTSLSYFGFLVPFFYRGMEDETLLLAGSEFGEVFVYSGITSDPLASYTFEGYLQGLERGWRSSVAIGHLTQDTVTDLFVGNYAGGLGYYQGVVVSENNLAELKNQMGDMLLISPNPGSGLVKIDANHLQLKPDAFLEIFDSRGILCRSISIFELPWFIQTSELMDGIYILKLVSGHRCVTGKLVIDR